MAFLLSFSFVYTQKFPEKGVPEMENFTPSDHGATGKIWEIKSSGNGLIYCASEKGLLEYDGNNWRTFKGSKGFTRSITIANDSTIYTGSDMDFGVWKRNKLMFFEYQSLYPFKEKASKESEEFWTVAMINDSPVFVSHHNIYFKKAGKFSKIVAPTRFSESFYTNGKLYLCDQERGLYTFDGNRLNLLTDFSEKKLSIIGHFQIKNQSFFVTKNNGVKFLSHGKLHNLENEVSKKLKTDIVFSFAQIDSSHLVFGTILNGFYITDVNGNIIHHIDRQKGLLNNTILSLYYDPSGNLYAGMDYGFVKINLKDKTNYFIDFQGNFGTGYSALLQNSNFYLGTNQGLYKSSWQNLNNSSLQNNFSIISGSEGQVWSLKNVDNEVLMGHDLGLFRLVGNSVQKISGEHGIWTIKTLGKNYILTGNYNGISVFRKENGNWNFVKKVNGIVGSCNQIEIINNILWVNIPNYGLIRVVLDEDFNPVKKTIFPIENFYAGDLQLISKKQKIHVKVGRFDYQFDEVKGKFTLISNVSLEKEIKGLLNGFSTPISLTSNYLFYPIYNGFALKNITNSTSDFKVYPLMFRGLEIFNNDTKKVFSLENPIPFRFNNVRLSFIIPQVEGAIYQHRFGETGKWSNWTTNSSFEFLDIEAGNHNFYVQAKVDGKLTNIEKISFTVKPAWYNTWLAYFIYFLISIGLYFVIKKRQLHLLKKQEESLKKQEEESLKTQQEKHEQEKLLLQQEQLEREKDILQQKVKDKTIELAQKAKDDEDKNRLLLRVTEKVQEIENDPNLSKIRLKEIRRMLNSYLESEDHTFEIQMDELHQEFFKSMKNDFPSLSIYDLRLCAYLKIGLTSKEMADILQVLPSSINVSRSRLRKKLGLQPDDDLYDFLNRF